MSPLQEYSNVLDLFEKKFSFFSNLHSFLHTDIMCIQIAAVDCLAHVFNKLWFNQPQTVVHTEYGIKDFHADLYRTLQIEQLLVNDDDDTDTQTRQKSIRLQVYCAIIAKCYILQKECVFLLNAFANEQQISQSVTAAIMKTLCSQSLHIDVFDLTRHSIPYLISKWISHNLHISGFPWHLTKSESFEEFVLDNKDSIVMAVLQHQRDFLEDLMQMMNASSLAQLLTDVRFDQFSYDI